MPPVPYTPQTISEQLEQSLRRLKTDHIDYYLLHECHGQYLQPGILECLDRSVQEGKIRHYGIGSGRLQSRCILEKFATVPWVVQIPDGWANCDTDWFAQRAQPPLFTHSSLRLSLQADPGSMEIVKRRWAELSDQDPDQPELLSELLLSGALLERLEARRTAVETLLHEQQRPAGGS